MVSSVIPRANDEQVSINQLITTAVAEKMAAMMTESYLHERAKRGKRADFDRVLRKVRSAAPDENDRRP
jgi:hypothetical protein